MILTQTMVPTPCRWCGNICCGCGRCPLPLGRELCSSLHQHRSAWLIAMADDVIELTYEGDPAFAGFFAQKLREEGLTVSCELPEESRDWTAAATLVGVVFTITGPVWPAIWNAVKKFKASRLGQGAKISGPPELEMSTEDRLAMLDKLLKQGAITEEEHAEHRARILGEL
jgi:hypothetical protein